MREDVGCRIADAYSPLTAHHYDLFATLIEPGHIDLMAEPCIYLDIAKIGHRYVHRTPNG